MGNNGGGAFSLNDAVGYDDDSDEGFALAYEGVGRTNRLGAPATTGTVGSSATDIVDRLRKRAGLPTGVLKTLRLWRRMGDERLRKHVVAVSIRQNRVTRELIAYADGSVWVSEFTMMRTAVLVEWNSICEAAGEPDLCVQKVTFRLSKGARAAGATGSIATDGAAGDVLPVELNGEERARVRAICGVISDDRLRRSAMRAMTSVMEWKKGEAAQEVARPGAQKSGKQ